MKKLVPIVMLLFFGLSHAQTSFITKEIKVLPSSELTITGDTNINKFECGFNTSFLQENQTVYYLEDERMINFSGAVLTLNTKGFDCGSRGINKDFHDLIQSDKHPFITIELNRVNLKKPGSGIANLCITIAGKQKFYDVPVAITEAEISRFEGTLRLNINDFDLQPPKKLFGMIVVKEDIEINFNLRVKK